MSMLDPLPENPYTTLGVAKDATVNDVKKAYRKLVLTCHPDKTGTLPASMKKEKDEQFHKVQQAHDLLTNPNERQRYDDRVQLEELRSELRRDLGKDGMPPSMYKSASFSHKSRSAPKTPSKSPTNPMFDAARGPPIYETRVPKGVYDEDVYGARPRSSRKHEERFEAPPTPRRTMSGRGDRFPEDIKKPERKEDDEEYYARKSREKASKEQQKTAQDERKKQRTKMRRNDGVSKRHAFVESESDEEDSEVEHFMASSPRTTEFRRQDSAPKPKGYTSARRTESASVSDSESDVRLHSAREHMLKTGSRFDSLEKRSLPTKKKTSQAVPPPPPPPPSKPAAESRRPATTRRSTSNSKSKRNIGIVEPSKEYQDDNLHELPRRPKKEDNIPHSVPSSPRVMPKSARAQTFEPDRSNDRPPLVRRTQTMPVNGRPSRASNLRHTKLQKSEEEDEEESARSSEDKTAKYTTKKYRINTSDSDSDRKPRIVSVEPDSPVPSPTMATATRSRARREESPRHRSHRPEVRSPPRRSNTMDTPSSHKETSSSSRPRHHHSGSGDKLLFMEVPPDVSFAPRINRDDVRYAEQRRSSTDGALPSRSERSKDKEHRRGKDDYYHARRGDHHPGLQRGGASYTSVHV